MLLHAEQQCGGSHDWDKDSVKSTKDLFSDSISFHFTLFYQRFMCIFFINSISLLYPLLSVVTSQLFGAVKQNVEERCFFFFSVCLSIIEDT